MTRSTLDRARDGSERAFGELVEPHRRELYVHCYRMLGSLADAEDMLQETLLAAWRGLDGFAGRSSVRAWLYRIATNRCLNAIRDSRRRAAEPVPPFTPPEPSRRSAVTWLQPCPDALLEPGPADRHLARETVELAFVAALQELPPRQVAALLLCDVLGFTVAETAAMLGSTPVAAKGALQRARARTRPARHSPAGPDRERELARAFARAYTEDDVDGVIALLTDDAWLAMPPAPHEYHGRAAVRGFLLASARGRGGGLHLVPIGANRQPAFGCYLAGEFTGVVVLTVDADGIAGVTRFLDPTLAPAFGLPPRRSS